MIACDHVDKDPGSTEAIGLLYKMQPGSKFSPVSVVQITSNEYECNFFLNRKRYQIL